MDNMKTKDKEFETCFNYLNKLWEYANEEQKESILIIKSMINGENKK